MFRYLFTSNPLRNEGVRPINIWGLRLFYFLMLVFVTPSAWHTLLSHQGPWDPLRAVTICVWATYPALAVFGLSRPLRWLPLMFFAIAYKALWLAFVAWPLWRSGMLAGSPAGEIAYSFAALPLVASVVPWGYAYRTFVAFPRRRKIGGMPAHM